VLELDHRRSSPSRSPPPGAESRPCGHLDKLDERVGQPQHQLTWLRDGC
jgi:hypothetical protein